MVIQQSTSFIGRTHELAEIAALLADPACRLLTLVGPGGIGKTRLALEVVTLIPDPLLSHGEGEKNRIASLFPNGVHFVPLQPVADAALLPIAIANAIGIQFFGADEPRAQLLNYLRERQTLLILDNFEHLLDSVDFVVEFLGTPGIKLLVTSRSALNIQAEWRYAVNGLTVPDLKPLALRERGWGEGFENYDAVKLFAERARRLRHDFSPADHPADMIRICQLTEGMPLAIELAAGWIKALSCAEIGNEIQRGLDFLAADARDIPERHRSMAVAFSQSWAMLTESEQAVFRRMSVFRGGFTREAAEKVTGATLQILASLVDKSFLRIDVAGRYDVHELLRQYGEAKLEAAGEVELIRDAHCTYFAGFMHQREARIKGRDQLHALNEIDADFENIRLMWQRAVARLDHEAVNRAMESLYLSNIIRRPHQQHHILFDEACKYFAPRAGEGPTTTWGRLLVRSYEFTGNLHGDQTQLPMRIEIARQIALREKNFAESALCMHIQGRFTQYSNTIEAIQHYQESLAYYETTGEVFYRAYLLQEIAYCYAITHQPQKAIAFWRKGLEICRQHHIQSAMGRSLTALGQVEAFGEGNYVLGTSYIQEAVKIYRDLGFPGEIARSGRWLSHLYFLQGDFDKAQTSAEEARDIALDLPDFELFGVTQSIRGMLTNLKGDYQAGIELCQKGLQYSVGGSTFVIAHWALGCTYCGIGDMRQATSHLLAALLAADRLPVYSGCVLFCLPIAAFIRTRNGDAERAAALLGLAFSHPKAAAHWLEQWPLLTQLHAGLEATLGTEIYGAAWERGKNFDLEKVVAEIIAEYGTEKDDRPPDPDGALIDSLTEREREVLRCVAAGLSNAQIADQLVISLGTAKAHVHNIYGKLGVESRTQAIARARELHLI